MEAIDESRVFGRNRIYFGRMTALSLDEITKRTKIATASEIALIRLFNRMEAEYRKSLFDFMESYGGFSDRLNKIYDVSERAALGSKTSLSEAFSELKRREFAKLLPITAKRLKEYETDISAAWLFSAARAMWAARDNTNALCNCAQLDGLKRSGYKYKGWRTIMDGKERDDHAAANGQVVPIDCPFIVGGYRMMFPKDSTYGAPLHETANCRCMIVGVG